MQDRNLAEGSIYNLGTFMLLIIGYSLLNTQVLASTLLQPFNSHLIANNIISTHTLLGNQPDNKKDIFGKIVEEIITY